MLFTLVLNSYNAMRFGNKYYQYQSNASSAPTFYNQDPNDV